MFKCHCIEKFKGFVFMYGLLGKLWILAGVLLPYLYITQILVFSIGQETIVVQKFLTDQWDQAKATKRTRSSF